jgi:hypothetical protein
MSFLLDFRRLQVVRSYSRNDLKASKHHSNVNTTKQKAAQHCQNIEGILKYAPARQDFESALEKNIATSLLEMAMRSAIACYFNNPRAMMSR